MAVSVSWNDSQPLCRCLLYPRSEDGKGEIIITRKWNALQVQHSDPADCQNLDVSRAL